MYKQVQFKTIGMNRDLSESSFNSKFAYENMNIRITPTNNNTLFSITNEKGNKTLDIEGVGACLEGCPIGQAVIDNEWVIFTTDNNGNDKIYKLWFEGETLKGEVLYSGNLKFSTNNPIETLEYYENEDIKKVYWIDGINQTRVINIATSQEDRLKWTDTSFDFTSILEVNESVSIERSTISGGVFSPGTIQYVFTYYTRYGKESNVFYSSPLYYTSFDDRGGSPEDKVSNSFYIKIENLDTKYDYLRIYSIHRTSLDGTPEIKRVTDLYISKETKSVSYFDNGTSGNYIDPTELLYVGGEEVIFNTFAQKDNTLFLGNYTIKRRMLDSSVVEHFKNGEIIFESLPTKKLIPPEPVGNYPYKNQLSLNSQQIKTFKYLEWYRFGVQFQHYTGKWSEPVWVNDVKNTQPIITNFASNDDILLPLASHELNDANIIQTLLNQGYIKIRPVVVYPSINDREAICQGVLCPTVYNVKDRYENAPFAKSSWFVRPNIPFDIDNTYSNNINRIELLNPNGEMSIYSKYGIIANINTRETSVGPSGSTTKNFDIVNKGAWAEFRHNKPIPGNDKRNAEIQCITNPPSSPDVPVYYNDSEILDWVKRNSENYYVDQNIVTLHSPEIEFDDEVKNFDLSNLKLRIIGVTPLTAFVSDIDIQTSTPPNKFNKKDAEEIEFPKGFYKESVLVENVFTKGNLSGIKYGDSYFGYKGLLTGPFWFDEISEYNNSSLNNTNNLSTGFVVYPWHRNGSLNNSKASSESTRTAMLDKKKLSNLRYSYKTQYLTGSRIWEAYKENDNGYTGISGVSIFNSNENTLIKLPPQKNIRFNLDNISYYGNVDEVLTIPTVGDKKDGYPIMTSGRNIAETNAHDIFAGDYITVGWKYTNSPTDSITDTYLSTDSIRIKYKSTPHAVLALNYTADGRQKVLPTLFDSDYGNTIKFSVNTVENETDNGNPMFWDMGNSEGPKIVQDSIDVSFDINGGTSFYKGIEHGWLWLGELYNDNVVNRFGGTTEEAFENNLWLPCGNAVSLGELDENSNLTPKDSIRVEWLEGDTFYQRYDHIKTYPYSLDDQNAVTDIISFMCETKVNLDGRYDRNRGLLSNLAITPDNFNKINNVYSQKNNFFSYRYIRPNMLNLNKFSNSITWTKTKTAGELVDTWTNITLASTLDLDGDKGPITAIRNINDKLIAFQPSGISQILYNDNVQMASTEGVPIEIANSGKVIGKRYFTDQVGCTNKWSICSTPFGLFFIDDLSKGIYSFSEGITDVSNKLGFDSWIRENSKVELWDPLNFKSFITYYDRLNKELLFISKDTCLAYSGALGQFTSFYNYEGTPYFANIKDRCLSINKGYSGKYKVWLRNGGDYNMFYGEYKPFYTTVLVNPELHKDKTFNTVEFRSDSWDEENTLVDETFDTLKVWNEYQEGESDLYAGMGVPSTLKRKFRIWRANIPRDGNNCRDRIRNTWAYVKLSKEQENINRTTLHDLIVTYFE